MFRGETEPSGRSPNPHATHDAIMEPYVAAAALPDAPLVMYAFIRVCMNGQALLVVVGTSSEMDSAP